jgi:hypothetical protein
MEKTTEDVPQSAKKITGFPFSRILYQAGLNGVPINVSRAFPGAPFPLWA